jgi:hypothetical protein
MARLEKAPPSLGAKAVLAAACHAGQSKMLNDLNNSLGNNYY